MVCHSVYMDFYETVTAYKPGAKIPPWPWHKYPAKWGGFFFVITGYLVLKKMC